MTCNMTAIQERRVEINWIKPVRFRFYAFPISVQKKWYQSDLNNLTITTGISKINQILK